MKIIKLDAIDSTNSFLRKMYNERMLEDLTVVVAKKQTAGRGQMGAKWNVEGGKNLTASVFKETGCLEHHRQFYLSMAIALAVYDTLNAAMIPELSIKWPNDILSGNKKICGILIDTIVKESGVIAAIIGIGLNVNQTDFNNLPRASSLKLITGRHFEIEELLLSIVERFGFYANSIVKDEFEALKGLYEKYLFRKNKPSTFLDRNGRQIMGFIRNVSESGKLVVELEDSVFREFDLKELQLLY